jgi:hypothetical protein
MLLPSKSLAMLLILSLCSLVTSTLNSFKIIQRGLRLNFTGKIPTKYKEKKNKSFEKNVEFGVGEVLKLLANWVREEVEEGRVTCINSIVCGEYSCWKEEVVH